MMPGNSSFFDFYSLLSRTDLHSFLWPSPNVQEIPDVACFVSVMLGCCKLIQKVPVLRQKISPSFFEFRRPRGLWDREALLQFETQPSTRWKAADLKGL